MCGLVSSPLVLWSAINKNYSFLFGGGRLVGVYGFFPGRTGRTYCEKLFLGTILVLVVGVNIDFDLEFYGLLYFLY